MSKYVNKHQGVLSGPYGLFALGVLLGLIFLAVFAALSPARAQNWGGAPIPQQMILGTNTQEVHANILQRCLTMGWQLAAQNSNQIVCTHGADFGATIMNTPMQGQGRPPEWRFVVTMADIPSPACAPTQTLVTVDLYFQSFTWAGTEAQRLPMTRESRRQAENALRDLQRQAGPDAGDPTC